LVGERVDFVQARHESSQQRALERRLHPRDVHLRQVYVVFHHATPFLSLE
jgi:hypothetical protein